MPEALVSDKEFICGCGFASSTKSGLSNHRKTCRHPEAAVPGTKTVTLVKAEPPLSTVDRNQFAKRITDRAKSMLMALTEELDGNPERVIDTMRREKGISLTVQQIQDLIEGMDRQIDSEVGEHIAEEEEKIQVKIADLEEEYDEIERDMKERHHKEWREMRAAKKAKVISLKQQIKNVKDKVTEEKVGHLKKQRDNYKLQLIRTRQLEQEVKYAQEQRVALLKRQRGRLTHIINDAQNRALEKLLVTTSRDEAGRLIEQIPTVSEALNMCSSPDGFMAFMKKLDPNMALPAPANMEIDEATLKQAKLEEEKEEAKENEEEETNDDHDDIYDEESTSTRRVR